MRLAGQDLTGGAEPPLRYILGKVRRHLYWARNEGLRKAVEEEELNPLIEVPDALRKRWWRLRHGVTPGSARPVYVVGLQRSGTNMVVRGLDRAPEFEVHNENDRTVFSRYQLRSTERVAQVVAASRQQFVLFKPLCDSDRVTTLLDDLGTAVPGRAVWIYRAVDGRVRSAVTKFGDHDQQVLATVAAGGGGHLWQARALTARQRELVASLDPAGMTPASGSALLWYLRNELYFELGLDRRDDVALVSYDAFVRDADAAMRALCAFLGARYRPALVAHVDRRSWRPGPQLDIDPRVRRLCDDLTARLDAAATAGVASR